MERLLSWSWLQEPFTAKGNLLALDAFGNQSLTELDGWYGLGGSDTWRAISVGFLVL